MKIIPFINLFFISLIVSATERRGPPPIGLLLLPFDKVYEGEPVKGAYGVRSYCYKVNGAFTVYSQNLLGEGYSLQKEAPHQYCNNSDSQINTQNELGLTVGQGVEVASELLGVELSDGKNRFQWSYQRAMRNLPYDDLTTLEVTVKNGIVQIVSVFNSVTH